VQYAAILERWHCSFDELIERHTEGQVLLLCEGTARWQHLLNAEAEKQHKRKGGTTAKQNVRKLPKPPKFTSAAEYNKWMASQGMGGL
jgi:hypothetical protein